MLPRHRIASTVHISSATSLDTVVTFVAPASNDDNTDRRGVFFVLIHVSEIDALIPWLNTFVHFLHQTYNTVFQEQENATVERAVAITQQRAKHKLQQIVSEARSLSSQDISYCLGAVNGYDVHIAHCGNVKAYLLHTLKSQYEEESRYRWIDITQSDADSEEDDQSAVSIVSGRMQPNDTLFLCSESITDGLSLESLQKIISRASVDGAKMQLEKAVTAVGGRVSYGAVILRPTVEHIAAELPAYKIEADKKQDSMTHLHHSERTANELLDPKRHPSPFGGLLDRLRSKKTDAKSEPKHIKQTESNGNPFSVNTKRGAGVKQQASETVIKSGKIIDALTSYLRSLPHSSRRFLLIALMLGYLFTQSLVFLANRETEEKTVLEQQQTIEQIQDSLDQAESSLIFNNDQETARLLSEAESLIEALPRDTKTQEERHRILTEEASTLRQRLEKVHQSETQTLVSINFPVDLLTLSNGDIVTASRTGNYKFISSNGEINDLVVEGLDTTSAELIGTDETGQVYISTNQNEIELNLADNTLLVKPIEDTKPVVDLVHYQDRLYALSAKDQQIYRYNGGATYTNPSPWVNGNANVLSTASSMIVDGNIFVLTNTGEIYKYSRGVIQNWTASPTYGETEGMSKLISPVNSNYLYALDSERNRIAMWEKDSGKLLNQFSFPALGKIIDFDVRADNQLMYLLTSSEIATAAIVK